MKKLLLWIAAGLFLCAACSAQSASPLLTIHNVTIIDTTGGPVQSHRTVSVRDGRIEEIVDSSAGMSRKLPGIHMNGTGKFLIPGLWDMHVHMVFGDWFPHGKEITLPLFIANGITGVRDMGSELEVLQQWRKEINAGTLIGPRMWISGPMLDGPQPRFPSSLAIKTPDDGRRAVVDLKRRGADFIKLQSLIPREAVFAIADEARKQGITFV
ncbi:MAG: amidohydrolase family protein, partial [Candidatus Sulfotelmatobacter sp.]